MNREEFQEEINKLNIKIDDTIINKLEVYYQILTEENSKYNLTRITTLEDVFLKHFYDSLTINKIVPITSQSICDLGSGAGFPGLVLAIFNPSAKLTLIEANAKKCHFLTLVKERLQLNNVDIINARIEEYSREHRELFDIVTARALAPLKHILEYGIPLVKVDGYLVAMKANINDELQNIDTYYQKLNICEEEKIIFSLPKEGSTRTLIKYRKVSPTPSKYPRRYAEILKREIR